MKWTTVGRFWGYVGLFIALATSLAGNIYSASLHTPGTKPSWTEIAFAGLPPLVAFVSIELANHNPWSQVPWGKYITRTLLFVVAPGSAFVSFVHLTLVGLHSQGFVVPDDLQKVLNVITSVLTSLLIDGLILGATGALLIPVKKKVEAMAEQPVVVVEQPKPVVPKPVVVKARLAHQSKKPVTERKRFAPTEHPLWDAWVAARGTADAWNADAMVLEFKKELGQEITPGAATVRLSRWEKELARLATV